MDGLPTAWQVEESTVRSRTQSPQGATYGMVVNTYEASGWFRRLSTTLDHGRTTSSYAAALGDDGSYDHTCTKFEYAAATDRFPVGLPHRVSVHSSSLCSETSVISDQRTFYDYESGDDPNPPAPGELMRGRVSGVWTAVGDSTSVVTGAGVGVGYVYEKTGWEQGSGYGGYFSRPTSTTDARGFTTNIKYRQRSNATSDTNPDLNAAGNHNTYRVQTDNALGDSSYEYFDNYGNHARSTDANLRFSVACYDSLRRLTKVFLPGDPYPTGSTCSFSPSNPPSMQYSYTNAAVPPANTQNFPPASSGFTTVPRWTTSATVMDGSYTASGYRYTQTWTHLDGLARVVETQTPSPVQDMVTLTKTSYDGRGNAYRQSEPYAKSGTAGSPPLNNPWSQVDRGTEQVFDSAGRLVETRLLDNGTPIRHTIVEPERDSVCPHRESGRFWYYPESPNLLRFATLSPLSPMPV